MVNLGEVTTESDIEQLERKMKIVTAITFIIGLLLPSPLVLL